MKASVRIGTRGSHLAIKQAEVAKNELLSFFPSLKVEIIPIKTKGDKILDKTLDKIGGKGVFVKEIENALIENAIDIAVHSMKDLPDEMPKGLFIGCVLARENPMDVLISKDGKGLHELPKGAKIGTGSLRRKVQLLEIRKDFDIVPIRGNIHTRLEKMEKEYDALVLAAAGLHRSGLSDKITHYFKLEEMIPASCQGILALQIRENDSELKYMLDRLNVKEADVCQRAERAFLRRIGADCHAPAGALAVLRGNMLELTAMFYTDKLLFAHGFMHIEQAERLGEKLADEILLQC